MSEERREKTIYIGRWEVGGGGDGAKVEGKDGRWAGCVKSKKGYN